MIPWDDWHAAEAAAPAALRAWWAAGTAETRAEYERLDREVERVMGEA